MNSSQKLWLDQSKIWTFWSKSFHVFLLGNPEGVLGKYCVFLLYWEKAVIIKMVHYNSDKQFYLSFLTQ